MTATASPRPWRVAVLESNGQPESFIVDADGEALLEISAETPLDLANLALIVDAVNAFTEPTADLLEVTVPTFTVRDATPAEEERQGAA